MKLELSFMGTEEGIITYLKASQYSFILTECMVQSLSIATGVRLEHLISIQQIHMKLEQLCLVELAGMDTEVKALLGTVFQDIARELFLSTGTGKRMV